MLVRLIANQGQRGMRIDELTQASGLSATTVFRMVQGLMHEGVVERDPRTHKLYLGRLMHQLGLAARRSPLQVRGREALDGLAGLVRRTQGVIYLSDRSGAESVCVDRLVSDAHPGFWPLDVGVRNPLGFGVGGLAILGAQSDPEVAQVVQLNRSRYERHGGLGVERLHEDIRGVRERGFATRDSVLVPGVAAVGVSFQHGDSTAALTLACMKGRLDGSRVDCAVEALMQASSRIRSCMEGLRPS